MTPPSLSALARSFARIGCLSFGGPAGQIALMHREIVEQKAWVSQAEYLRALSLCTLLPGPEAMQLATWMGWRSHGVRGGLVTGGLFVLPGAVVILCLAALYAAFGAMPAVQAAFAGVQAAVLAIVALALVRLSRGALRGVEETVCAVLALAALALSLLPFPALIMMAGLYGAWRGAPQGRPAAPMAIEARAEGGGGAGGGKGSWRAVAICAALWLVPLAACLWWGGILAEIAAYFARLAIFSFGGAYAALSWMASALVADKGWLEAGEMLDALALAETTPGPLVLVTAFVGYLAAFKQGGAGLGLAGGLVTLWMIFLPSFLMIFALAPWVDRLDRAPRLAAGLAMIRAAVVGMIAQLSLWFAGAVLFGASLTLPGLPGLPLPRTLPDPASLRPGSLAIAVLAGLLLAGRVPIPLALLLAAAGGLALAPGG